MINVEFSGSGSKIMSQSLLYTFTGNPFVDAGIWAICEWSGRKKPEEIEIEDLKEIAFRYSSYLYNYGMVKESLFYFSE